MFLSRILEAKRAEVAERSARRPLAELRTLAARAPEPRDFAGALRRPSPDAAAPFPGARAPVKGAPTPGPLRRPSPDAAAPFPGARAPVKGAPTPGGGPAGAPVKGAPTPGLPGVGAPFTGALAVIAEVKRASPSKGPLRPDLDAAGLARQYEAGGCAAISVLTDGPHFGARRGDLEAVRAAVSVPVLRKDFLLEEYQLWEARAMGADAVLLIAAALEAETLARLASLARGLGMATLVEVHAAEEVPAALASGSPVVGINNRDLHSFRVDLETTRRLRTLIPPEILVVSESGIAGPREAALVRGWGADAVLVGESLVLSEDPAAAIRGLRTGGGVLGPSPSSRGEGRGEGEAPQRGRPFRGSSWPFVEG